MTWLPGMGVGSESQLRPVKLILDGIYQDPTDGDQIVLLVQENGLGAPS